MRCPETGNTGTLGKAQVARDFEAARPCGFLQVRREQVANAPDQLTHQWHTMFTRGSDD